MKNLLGWLLMTICLCLGDGGTTSSAADSPLGLDPVDQYILAWERSGGMESASRHHVHDLLTLLGVPTPDSPRPDLYENVYAYEMTHHIINNDGTVTTGMSDLCYEGHVLIEMKQGHNPEQRRDSSGGPFRRGHAARGTPQWDTVMVQAREQAFRYALSMQESSRPPFVIVWDLGYVLEIFSDLNNTGVYTAYPSPMKNRIYLDDLRDVKVRDMLRRIWIDPYSLDPMRESHRVTQEVAQCMGRLAISLEERGYDSDATALFVARCVFTMLAEDMRMLRNNTFLDLLKESRNYPKSLTPRITELWRSMYSGGYCEVINRGVWEFGSDFFEEAKAIPLSSGEIDILIQAAECQWYHVDPIVMASMVEATLSTDKRLGAFYTHPSYAEKVVIPTVMEPLRAKWAESIKVVQAYASDKDFDAARKAVREFHRTLASVRVLDPNCGSANFLSVTLAQLKDLEAEVFAALHDLGESRRSTQQIRNVVSPSQMHGIEVNPRAAQMARLVLIMTDLKKHYQLYGRVKRHEPILRDLPSIECRDAILTWDSTEPLFDKAGNPVMRWDRKTFVVNGATGLPIPDENALVQDERYVNARPAAPYPEVDYIVGNPVFLGAFAMKRELGEGYTTALRKSYPFLPDSVDLSMYVWARSAMLLRDGEIDAMGLITTDSISRSSNQKVVQSFLEGENPLMISMACPDMPWWSEGPSGAKVRVAMTVLRRGSGEGTLYSVIGERAGYGMMDVELMAEKGVIHSNLSLTPSPDGLSVLHSNASISSTGMVFGNRDFVITREQAEDLGLDRREGLEQYIRPVIRGRDLSFSQRGFYGIDFYGLSAEDVEQRYPDAFGWLQARVYPERRVANDAKAQENWWLPRSPHPLSRVMQEGIESKIITPITSVSRFFVFVSPETICDGGGVFEVYLDDAFHLGVLTSSLHTDWALVTGARHRAGYRYLSRCFTMFPFPDCDEDARERVRDVMRSILEHREKHITGENGATMAAAQGLLAKMKAGEAFDEREAGLAETLQIAELHSLHQSLDKAVLKAYGWKQTMKPGDRLDALYRLNKDRAAEERAGKVRWLRPNKQLNFGGKIFESN